MSSTSLLSKWNEQVAVCTRRLIHEVTTHLSADSDAYVAKLNQDTFRRERPRLLSLAEAKVKITTTATEALDPPHTMKSLTEFLDASYRVTKLDPYSTPLSVLFASASQSKRRADSSSVSPFDLQVILDAARQWTHCRSCLANCNPLLINDYKRHHNPEWSRQLQALRVHEIMSCSMWPNLATRSHEWPRLGITTHVHNVAWVTQIVQLWRERTIVSSESAEWYGTQQLTDFWMGMCKTMSEQCQPSLLSWCEHEIIRSCSYLNSELEKWEHVTDVESVARIIIDHCHNPDWTTASAQASALFAPDALKPHVHEWLTEHCTEVKWIQQECMTVAVDEKDAEDTRSSIPMSATALDNKIVVKPFNDWTPDYAHISHMTDESEALQSMSVQLCKDTVSILSQRRARASQLDPTCRFSVFLAHLQHLLSIVMRNPSTGFAFAAKSWIDNFQAHIRSAHELNTRPRSGPQSNATLCLESYISHLAQTQSKLVQAWAKILSRIEGLERSRIMLFLFRGLCGYAETSNGSEDQYYYVPYGIDAIAQSVDVTSFNQTLEQSIDNGRAHYDDWKRKIISSIGTMVARTRPSRWESRKQQQLLDRMQSSVRADCANDIGSDAARVEQTLHRYVVDTLLPPDPDSEIDHAKRLLSCSHPHYPADMYSLLTNTMNLVAPLLYSTNDRLLLVNSRKLPRPVCDALYAIAWLINSKSTTNVTLAQIMIRLYHATLVLSWFVPLIQGRPSLSTP